MTILELKKKITEYREGLEEKSGVTCMFSETGPVGMSVIDDIISVLEELESRIAKLEHK